MPEVAPSPFRPPWRDAATFVATFAGAGLLPRAPGTWGSLATLPVGWALLAWLGWPGVLAAAAVAALIGWWACETVLARTRAKDPGAIVIDEVAGQLMCLAVIAPVWWQVAIAFAFFRLFDITKPYPANWADRSLSGGLGVMADDVIAGLYGMAATAAAVSLIEEALT